MADLKTQISITADASGVETGVNKAKRSIRDLGATAASSGRDAAAGIENIGKGGDKAAARVESATKGMIASIQRQIAITEAGSRSGAEYYRVLASQRGIDGGALKPYLDQLEAVSAKQRIAEAALNASTGSLNRVGVSAKQTAAALRGVPAQFTDIAVSLQGGQNPLTVLLQQGGQLKDMFGGIGPAARALSGYVAGLINPFTLAAGAAGTLAFAYYEGSKEADNYRRSIVLTGNATGTTIGQMQLMAASIDDIEGTTGAAAEGLATMAATGSIAAANLEKFTAVALKLERVTGQAVSETAKQFAELKKAPLEASIRLNEGMNYLTKSIYEQIKALEDQGRTTDAATVAQNAFADATASRTKEIEANLGIIERGWKGVKDAISEAWDAAKGIGRVLGPEAQVAAQQTAVDSLRSRLANAAPWEKAEIKINLGRAEADLETARQQAFWSMEAATAEEQKAAGAKAFINWSKEGDKYLSRQLQMEREIAKARNIGREAGIAQVEIDKRIADIREKYADKGAASAGKKLAKSSLGFDVDQIRNASQALLNEYSNTEKIFEARRSAGLVADREYYDTKRKLLQDNAQAQIDALNAENERLSRERGTTDERINNEKRVADNLAKIAILKANTAANLNVLSTQETSAANRLKLAFMTARQSAQDYFDTIASQQARDLASMGMGNHQRNFNAGVNQIEDRYAGQRRDLENQRALLESQRDAQGNSMFDDAAKKQHENRLAIIDEFQGKSIASFTDYYAKLAEKQGNWSLGASEALKNYYDESRNTFQGAQQIATNALKGMEEAFTTFVTTGKLSFKDLASSIVADINRVIIKQQISNALGLGGSGGSGVLGFIGAAVGALGGGTSATAAIASAAPGDALDNFLALNKNFGGRAIGGPVSAGGMYEVNEKGRPELLQVAGKQYLMMGSQGGKVDANPQIGQRPIQVTIQQSFSAGTDRRTADQAAAQAGYAVRRGLARNA